MENLCSQRADRHYVDPPLSNQDIGLISFVPCNDAKPNKYGVYGFAKIRGTFANVDESRSKSIRTYIKNMILYIKFIM